jgi:hypothetical protein
VKTIISSVISHDTEIQVALIGIIGVVIGTVISVIASAVTEKRAHKRAKSLYVFQKQIEVYPLALEHIKIYVQLQLCLHQASQTGSDQSYTDRLNTLVESESNLHSQFFNTFWAVAPKRVREGFESLREEISQLINDNIKPPDEILSCSYKKLSDLLKINE